MLRRAIVLATVVFLSILTSTGAMATAQRTFVASYGNDANPCSIALPCRGFTAAVAQTVSGGEVVVLDSAGYGQVTITQSVSIIAPAGVYAGISSPANSDAATVSAGSSDKVVLHGLTINGTAGGRGILVASVGELHIEDCTLSNFAVGIRIEGGSSVHVARTTARSNFGGLHVAAGSPAVYVYDSHFAQNVDGVVVEAGTFIGNRVTVENNRNGVTVQTLSAVTVAMTLIDCVVTGHTTAGVLVNMSIPGSTLHAATTRITSAHNLLGGLIVQSTGVGTVTLVVAESAFVENGTQGIEVNGLGTTAIVSDSTVARNEGFDLAQNSSAVLRTSGNNTLTGRGAADVYGTITANPLQ